MGYTGINKSGNTYHVYKNGSYTYDNLDGSNYSHMYDYVSKCYNDEYTYNDYHNYDFNTSYLDKINKKKRNYKNKHIY